MITQDMQAVPSAAAKPPTLAREKREVFDVLLGNQRNGVKDMTRHEIRAGFMRLHGRTVERGQISAVVAKLLKAGVLEEGSPRICNCCASEGKTLTTVLIPATQVRLFA